MTARQSVDGNSFILNGTKTWVTNGTVADIFVVFARTEVDYIVSSQQIKYSNTIIYILSFFCVSILFHSIQTDRFLQDPNKII